MPGLYAPQLHAAPAGRGGAGHRCRHDAVGNNRVVAAAEGFYAVNDNRALPRAVNPRAAFVQIIGKVGNLRLTRRVGNRGYAVCGCRRKHNVLCRADARKRQRDFGAAKSVRRTAIEPAVALLDNRAHLPQCLQM